MAKKFVVAMMMHETNTFSPLPTPIESFARAGALSGAAALAEAEGTNTSLGGFTTQRYGRPGLARHALQIEINRALYMDEVRHEKLPQADILARTMAGFLAEMGDQALAALLPHPLAAE